MTETSGAPRPTVEFFFDYSSPWTYMAFHRVEALCAEAGAELVWRPFYVAGVFRSVNFDVAAKRANPVPVKLRHVYKDMQDWARRLGIVIGRPPVYGGGSKPLNSAKALRGAFFALDEGCVSAYSRAVFVAYWHDLRDVSDLAVLKEIAGSVGLNSEAFAVAVESDAFKGRLRANTDELIARGGFGTPTFFVEGDDMYFGNDRLDFVCDAVRRAVTSAA